MSIHMTPHRAPAGLLLLLGVAACASSGPPPENPKKILANYELVRDACGTGLAEACETTGVMFDTKKSLLDDANRPTELATLAKTMEAAENPLAREYAVQLGVRACRAGVTPACGRLSALSPDAAGAADQAGALEALNKECEAGGAEPCLRLAMLHALGLPGLPKNKTRALDFFKKGCDAGSLEACGRAGVMLYSGEGVATDKTKGKALLEKGCDGGYAYACHVRADIASSGFATPGDWKNAKNLWTKACNAGLGGSCLTLAGHLAKGGNATPSDWKQITELEQVGCDKGSPASCADLAAVWSKWNPPDHKKAAVLAEKACDGANAWGCSLMGFLTKDGFGVKKDKTRAKAFYGKACTLGDNAACDEAK